MVIEKEEEEGEVKYRIKAMRVPKKPRKHLLLQRDSFHVRRRRASTNLFDALLQLAIRPGGRQEAHTMALLQEVEAIIGSDMVKMGRRWDLMVGALNKLLLLLGLVVHGVELLKRVDGSHALHLLLLLLPSYYKSQPSAQYPESNHRRKSFYTSFTSREGWEKRKGGLTLMGNEPRSVN